MDALSENPQALLVDPLDGQSITKSPFFHHLPAETRNRIYGYAFSGIVLRPRGAHPESPNEKPSTALASLAVCKQWKEEVEKIIRESATYDLTYHGRIPSWLTSQDFENMRHVIVTPGQIPHWRFAEMKNLETCLVRQWPYWSEMETGIMAAANFDGPKLHKNFLTMIKHLSFKCLIHSAHSWSTSNWGPFKGPHPPAMQLYQMKDGFFDPDKDPKTYPKITFEGNILAPGKVIHTKYIIDMESWEIALLPCLPGGEVLKLEVGPYTETFAEMHERRLRDSAYPLLGWSQL